MTDETKKLYEFLDQLKNWNEQLESEAKEFEAQARRMERKKSRKAVFRQAVEKYAECYAINEIYREFESKFDLGLKEVETRKEESKTLPGVFYDVIRLENARGEVKFRLKVKGEYCCHPNKYFGKTGILNFEQQNKIDFLVKVADCDKGNIAIVEDAMRAVGFGGDLHKPFRFCGIPLVEDKEMEDGEIKMQSNSHCGDSDVSEILFKLT